MSEVGVTVQSMSTETFSHRDHEAAERVLTLFERKWAPHFASVSLVTELDVAQHETAALLDSFGTLMTHRRQRLMRILNHVPSCVAVALTGAAIDVYQGGAFWPGFFQRLGTPGQQQDQQAWGEAFLRAIDTFELPEFRSDDRKYLGPILAHAGIPNYCLADYFVALDTAVRRVGLDATAVASWALPRVDTALANIDVPVRAFLARGDMYSVDFIDRTMDVLIRLSRDDDPSASRLPDRVVEAARRHLEAEPRGRRHYSARAATSDKRASLTLDVVDGVVKLTLPAIPRIDEDVEWLVTTGDQTERVRPAKQMGGAHIGTREVTHVVKRPAHTIHVHAAGLDRTQDIDLIDADDPIVFFTDNGEHVSGRLTLSGAEVWALYAAPTPDFVPGFSERVVHNAEPPLGWVGWRLSLLDLKGANSISLSPNHSTHRVRNDVRVALETTSLVPSARSGGHGVHAASPVLHIPDGIAAEWRLTVVDTDRGVTVVDRTITSSADVHDDADPFEGVPRPIVGRYSIAVRGPLGKGLTRDIAMAEGLEIEFSTRMRQFARGGLDEARANLSGPSLDVDHPELEFKATEVEKSTVVRARSASLEVLVTPPAMAVASVVDGIPTAWEYRAIGLATEDVSRTSLLLRVPLSGRARVVVVDGGGRLVQVLDATTRPSGAEHQALYELRDVADTLTRYGSCTIEVGDAERTRLARVAPRELAHGTLLTPQGIQLVDFAGGTARARLWPVFEPWRRPIDVDVPIDGVIAIPDDFATVGLLAVSLATVDPWVPASPPSLPGPGTYFEWRSVPLDGEPSTLALAGAQVDVQPLDPDRAWHLLEMRATAPNHFFKPSVVDALTASLRETATSALTALSQRRDGGLSPATLLVSSGLLWTEIEDPNALPEDATTDDRLAAAIAASPVCGALLATRVLARRESPSTHPSTWAAAIEELGSGYGAIVAGAPDENASAGILDHTRFLDSKSAAEYTTFLNQLNLVPRAVTDEDSRVAGGLELFGERSRRSVLERSKDAAALSELLATELGKIGGATLAAPVAARQVTRGELPVAHLSAVSIGACLVARLAARGLPAAKRSLNGLRPYLETLSRRAPRLLAADIVLAEAHICAMLSEEHPTMPGQSAEAP